MAQKELDQEKALHAKLQEETQKEYNQVIKEEKKKFERAKQEHENRLADLKKAHIEQCEELGREAMKAKLEADRLHNELMARGMDIPRHAIFNEKDSKTGFLGQSKLLILLSIFSIVSYSRACIFIKSHLVAIRKRRHLHYLLTLNETLNYFSFYRHLPF